MSSSSFDHFNISKYACRTAQNQHLYISHSSLSAKLLLNLLLNKLSHSFPIIRNIRNSLRQLLKTDKLLGKNLLLEVKVLLILKSKLNSTSELGGVGCGQRNVRDVGLGALGRSERGGDADGGVGIENVADLLVDVLDGLESLGVADTFTLKGLAGAVKNVHVDRAETALDLEILEPSSDFLTSLLSVELNIHTNSSSKLISQEPKQTLKVTRNQNVHSRAKSLLDTLLVSLDSINLQTALSLGALGRLLLVLSSLPESIKDIVLVSCDNKLVDGKTHASGKVSGEDVAKVSGGDDEADFVADLEGGGLLGEGEVGVEVVDDLGEDSGEVDGVDGAELEGGVGLGVAKEGLNDVLTNLLAPRERRTKGILTWQSSKVPVTARLCTLASVHVVI
jgi:hypothetical protein